MCTMILTLPSDSVYIYKQVMTTKILFKLPNLANAYDGTGTAFTQCAQVRGHAPAWKICVHIQVWSVATLVLDFSWRSLL